MNDFSGYNTPQNFAKPASLPAVELVDGTTIAFQKLNATCSTVSGGGAPCALAYVDVNEKASGDETPQFVMAIYRDRAVSEFELCEGYEGGKVTDVDCPADFPNGNKKKIETCNLGVITTTYEGICCPPDKTPDGNVCVCKNPDMALVDDICTCKNNKENVNGICVCEGKTEACQGNMVGSIIYDGVCSAQGKTFTLKKSTCECSSDLPNLKSDGKTCVAACSGEQVFENDICKCPDNLPVLTNGICTCPNIVKACSAPKVGTITYETTCSGTARFEGDKITDSCTCPSKDKIEPGQYAVYNPLSETCTSCLIPEMVKTVSGCQCPSDKPVFNPQTKTCQKLPPKVFIIASYNTAGADSFVITYLNMRPLSVRDQILDFASGKAGDFSSGNIDRTNYIVATSVCGGYCGLSGSWIHNRVAANDADWMQLLANIEKNQPDLLDKRFNKGEAYVIREDGTLLATISSGQVLQVDRNAVSATSPVADPKFKMIEPIGISTSYSRMDEEGSGGKIEYDGVIYDVVHSIYRKETPLVLDLYGNGLKLVPVENGVVFDLNADGKAELTAWTDVQTEFDDAFLVYDKNKNGQIDSGAEMFGNQNGAPQGFDELAKYDDNNDGLIDKLDGIFYELQVWCDMNKNGKVDEGELKTLDEAKITELSLSFENQYDENGNLVEDEHGNTVGLVGSFKMMAEKVIGGVAQMVAVVRSMIDVLFNTIQSFFA
ncbi:MAG: hypothetical protein PHX18_02075 [Candidatus Gastranaerophilales bacterium]|nr:hypothetical protein [Candidatus Gastranaerophilales bacterium]